MKIKIGLGFMFILLTALVFFIQDSSSRVVPNSSPIKIAVSQTPLSSPFIIAQHLKLFDQKHINVEFVPCSGGVACAKALFNNEVDFATASESVVMFESFKHDDLSVLTSFAESGNDLKLLALGEGKITSINELEGKKVGVVKASASEFYFDSLLIAHNLKRAQVQRVYLAPNELNNALITGGVDAISVWEPYGYAVMLESPDIINLGLEGVYNLTFNLLTRSSLEEQHMTNSVIILEQLNTAIQWMHAQPEQAKSIVAKALNIPRTQLDWSWQDYTFRLSIGNALLSNLQLQARWAIETELVERALPNYRRVLSPKALEHVMNRTVSYE
ncbi:ABC transporter substrate-binding protein [Vibrio genomosp. F10]|uniref:ABC transporter substrate-binding protein n=1 Tax=Vibrio genomosp. F10 TaxID=723171 RepID=A0A1B9QWN5_9VIBR|nr:ABC transporter substrate-binding protein [Vibrio genomosp. F10]OCH74051.1 ABC transporter substrate-binding protein [Vibrio genomosp. F10]OEE95156.1 ABC transporter substrate-binding protein [Vibrio genomosp. F10 str. 9ZD137]